MQPSTSFTTGDGGALFFGMGSLNASITKCTFSNNSAAQRGGAISSMALSSNITMNNTTASRNWAGNGSATQQLLGMAQGQQPGQRSEGGAVHVGGSTTTLLLRNVTMNSDEAAQVGCTGAWALYCYSKLSQYSVLVCFLSAALFRHKVVCLLTSWLPAPSSTKPMLGQSMR